MRSLLTLLVATSCLAATAAHAVTCTDDIAAVERRLNSEGAAKVTGEKPPGGTTSSNSDMALEKPPGGKPSAGAPKATAEGVEEARKLLAMAKSQHEKGDEKACQDTITKVKEKAGSLP